VLVGTEIIVNQHCYKRYQCQLSLTAAQTDTAILDTNTTILDTSVEL
jgi:hypothetical protein